MGTLSLPRGKPSQAQMTWKLQERSCGRACYLHAHVWLHLKAVPVMGAAELHAVLGHEVWKVSPEAGEYAQCEICVLEIKALEGKGQPFK